MFNVYITLYNNEVLSYENIDHTEVSKLQKFPPTDSVSIDIEEIGE